MSALADVARAAGVSKATASRALSGKGYVSSVTRARVRDVAAAIGYVVSPNAASLVTGQTQSVAVIIPSANRWFASEVIAGIEKTLRSRGYDMTLFTAPPDPTERDRLYAFFLARKRFDAVILVGVDFDDREAAALIALGKPMVHIGSHVDAVTSFAIDDRAAGQLATEHLIRLGHTTLAHIGGPDADRDAHTVQGRRLAGFRAAAHAVGLGTHSDYWSSPMTMPGGFTTARTVLGDPRHRPTAIFAGCDEVAFGTIIAARELGINVPLDLSVIGIDGHDYGEMFSLTTLVQHPYEIGVRAIIWALDHNGRNRDIPLPIERVVTSFELVVRSSTRAPRPQ